MDRFEYFVVFAEMRTGSNFLETNLNAFDGITCFGEAFNPHFIGYPNKSDILGVTQTIRDNDPTRLIGAIRASDGLGGFRFFHDHDTRIIDMVLDDPKCAKIILTRNPLDSYVSWKIARATNQWKLTDVKRRKQAVAEFDAQEFTEHVTKLQEFQVFLLNRLQAGGQTPFYVAYEDLQNLDVMNGLAKWLGIESQLKHLDKSLKVQNPSPTTDKVANPDAMKSALADLDRFNLSRTPNFEPRRGAAVPSYVAAVETPLIFLPISGGPVQQVTEWMAALDNVDVDALHRKMSQKKLRHWKRKMGVHRSFTVLRHPVARIHDVFCHRIVNTGPGSYGKIRDTLHRQFGLDLPDEINDSTYSASAHRSAFMAFLTFVKANLAGQTAIRVDGNWCSQSQALNSFADFLLPDLVLREEELRDQLPELAKRMGNANPPPFTEAAETEPFALREIYDDDIETLVADVYQRDYMSFGFKSWQPAGN